MLAALGLPQHLCALSCRDSLGLVQCQQACGPGTGGMEPGKFRLNFTIGLQPCNIRKTKCRHLHLFVEFNCEVINFLGTEVPMPLSPMLLKKRSGIFCTFKKK